MRERCPFPPAVEEITWPTDRPLALLLKILFTYVIQDWIHFRTTRNYPEVCGNRNIDYMRKLKASGSIHLHNIVSLMLLRKDLLTWHSNYHFESIASCTL